MREAAFLPSEELINYLNALPVRRSTYEYVVYESNVEKEFALSLTNEKTLSLL
jgi:type III restriction enzyme